MTGSSNVAQGVILRHFGRVMPNRHWLCLPAQMGNMERRYIRKAIRLPWKGQVQ